MRSASALDPGCDCSRCLSPEPVHSFMFLILSASLNIICNKGNLAKHLFMLSSKLACMKLWSDPIDKNSSRCSFFIKQHC